MAVKSRRRGREAALRALYEIEIGGSYDDVAFRNAVEDADLTPDLLTFAERVLRGVRNDQERIDDGLARLTRGGYSFDRLAAIDRNILRIAAYELLHEDAIPPAVTINEAVEIAKRFSTTESGRFVNGVLGNYVKGTPKANWDPKTAPVEFEPEEPAAPEPPPAVEEVTVEEGSQEAKVASRFGWVLRSGDAEIPPNTD